MIPNTPNIPKTEEKVKIETKHAQMKITRLNLAPFHKCQWARYKWNKKEARA